MGICASQKKDIKSNQTQPKNISTEHTKQKQPIKINSESTINIPKSPNSQLNESQYLESFGLKDNPQNRYFKTTRSFGVLKVQRVSQQFNDGNMYTFFKNGEIAKGQISKFRLKFHTKDKMFNVGIGTKATFGNKATDEAIKTQSKELWIDNKKCFIDNEMYPITQLLELRSLQVFINTKEWTIAWYNQSHHIVTKQIPNKMRGEKFYLTITLYNNADEVQILLY